MSIARALFAQPDDIEECNPDRDAISAAGSHAWDRVKGTRTIAWSAAAGLLWTERKALMTHGLLRGHSVLSELNNLMLPPLFTLILVEFATGGLPNVMTGQVEVANYVFCTAFLTEWALGLWLAQSRIAYFRNLWLLGIIAAPRLHLPGCPRRTRRPRPSVRETPQARPGSAIPVPDWTTDPSCWGGRVGSLCGCLCPGRRRTGGSGWTRGGDVVGSHHREHRGIRRRRTRNGAGPPNRGDAHDDRSRGVQLPGWADGGGSV